MGKAWTPGLAAGLLMLGLAACSVADYKQPIATFTEATRNAERALSELDRQVTEAYALSLEKRIFDEELFVRYASGDCLTTSERCRLVAVDRGGNVVADLTPGPALKQSLLLMGAIRKYAEGLSAIVDAETAAAASSQVNAALGSVANLGNTVVKLGGNETSPPLEEYTTAAGQAANWVVGQYVASVQVSGLKAATREAKPVVAEAALLFQTLSAEAEFVPRADLAEATSRRLDAFRENLTLPSYDALVRSAQAYDSLLVTKPSRVFMSMKEAHDALADELNSDKLTLSQAMAKVKIFAAEAETLAKIFQSLSALVLPQSEGLGGGGSKP